MRFIYGSLIFMLSLNIQANETSNRKQIEERIKPIGQVRLEEQPTPKKKPSVAANNNRGQEIYERFCSVCHRDGLAGAPKLHNQKDWQVRIKKRSLEDLLASAIKGVNAMPAKGTCIQCSDKELKDAIQFMLPNHE